MKKTVYSNYLPIVASLMGVVGFLLRLWTLGKGPDAEGLYEPNNVAWALLWIVTAALPVAVILMTRPLGEPGKYTDNFPASPFSAVGCLFGMVGVLSVGIRKLSNDETLITFLAGVLGVVAAVMLAVVAFCRLRGTRPSFFCHVAVCLFFAMEVFDQCRAWSNQPQLSVFVFPFLALICIMLAVYQLCAFDVELGNRRQSLLWSLSAVYLCLVALPGGENVVFFGCMAVWLLTNICSLRPVKKRAAPAPETGVPVQAQLSSNDVSIDEINSWLEDE